MFSLRDLKNLRKRYWLMQYDVCRYVGVSDIAYRTWEKRVRKPNDEHLDRLKYIFDVLDACSEEIKDRESAVKVLERELGEDE